MGESSFAMLAAEVVGLLRSVPDVVWSGIIGAVLAFGGVLMSNRSNTERLRIQLQHDAQEKARERTAILRREVYLKAAEEMTRASSYLASLPQVDLSKTNIADGLQGFFVAATKVRLVAETPTSLLIGELIAQYGKLFFNLMGRVMPLQDAKSDIAIHNELYEKAQAQISRVLGDMAKVNESGQATEQVFAALQRAFGGYRMQADRHAAARDQAWLRFNSLNADFCRQLFADLRPVGELNATVMVALRHDLGLTSDLDAFRQQMETQRVEATAQLNALLDSLAVREHSQAS